MSAPDRRCRRRPGLDQATSCRTSMTQLPITQVKPDVPLLEIFWGKGEEAKALYREAQEIIARRYGSIAAATKPAKPARKPRQPTLASALKQAAQAGKNVKGAEVYPDRVVLQFGDPTPINANPWDEVLIDAADQKRPS